MSDTTWWIIGACKLVLLVLWLFHRASRGHTDDAVETLSRNLVSNLAALGNNVLEQLRTLHGETQKALADTHAHAEDETLVHERLEALEHANRELASATASLPQALSRVLNNTAGEVFNSLANVQRNFETRIDALPDDIERRWQSRFAHMQSELNAVRGALEQLAAAHAPEPVETQAPVDPLESARRRLAACLSAALAPERYRLGATFGANGETIPALLSIPGPAGMRVLPVYLSRASVDYETMLAESAQQTADMRAAARESWSADLRDEADHVQSQLIRPPVTTDFVLLFLPSEMLYAEALCAQDLIESLARDHRVLVASPLTLAAMLASLTRQAEVATA